MVVCFFLDGGWSGGEIVSCIKCIMMFCLNKMCYVGFSYKLYVSFGFIMKKV